MTDTRQPHDLADAAGNPEPKLPTTEAERE